MKKAFTKRIGLTAMCAVLGIALIFSFIEPSAALKAGDNLRGLGYVLNTNSTEIFKGVNYTTINSINSPGGVDMKQSTHLVELFAGTPGTMPYVTYGSNVRHRETLTAAITRAENDWPGKKVLFGMNTQAWEVSMTGGSATTEYGQPVGLTIQNGRLITTPNAPYVYQGIIEEGREQAIGFKKDGSLIYGKVELDIKVTAGNLPTMTFNHINKERQYNNMSYILDSVFGETTRSVNSGVEVIVELDEQFHGKGFSVGGTIAGRVKEVVKVNAPLNVNVGNTTPIGANDIVLSAPTNNVNYNTLSNLTAQTLVVVDIFDKLSAEVRWSEAEQALGSFFTTAKNGVATGNTQTAEGAGRHPRSSISVKPDGTVMVMVNDGRQPDLGQGLIFSEMNEFLVGERGASHVYSLDGGGSSCFAVWKSGQQGAQIVNSPSDGNLRSCTAFLFFMVDVDAEGNPIIPSDPDVQPDNPIQPTPDDGCKSGATVALVVAGIALVFVGKKRIRQ